MKAVICNKQEPPEVATFRRFLSQYLKNDQILVKIIATVVNSGDARVSGFDVWDL